MNVTVKRSTPVVPPIESVTITLTGEEVKLVGGFIKRNENQLRNEDIRDLLDDVKDAIADSRA